jgi:hypothetical protein
MADGDAHARLLDALLRENAVLSGELARAQVRSQRRAAAYLRRIDELEADLLRCRAQLLGLQRERAQGDAACAWAERAMPCAAPASTVLFIGRRPPRPSGWAHAGTRWLHHDGGCFDDVPALDACLEQASLVICQTGCVGHEAYWRVQDHCRRTGKRCVLVDAPQQLPPPSAIRGSTPLDGAPRVPASET